MIINIVIGVWIVIGLVTITWAWMARNDWGE